MVLRKAVSNSLEPSDDVWNIMKMINFFEHDDDCGGGGEDSCVLIMMSLLMTFFLCRLLIIIFTLNSSIYVFDSMVLN